MPIRLKLEGQKFGKWTVIEYHSYTKYKNHRTGYHLWICKCDCGNEVPVREQLFKRGSSTQCKKCANNNLSIKYKKYQIPSKLYYDIINNQRNLEVNIDDTYLFQLIKNQKFKCALSGVPILLGNRAREETTASIDRIDSNKGYIKGNVQWVHKWINLMKQDMTDIEFIDWCNKVSDFNKILLMGSEQE